MRPTIFDVADRAGVSYATVSRVVNGQPSVRESTRQRVQAAMLELGYVAHVTARALARGRTQAIGLLAQEIDNPFFSVVIKGIDHEISAAGYDLLLCTTHNRREKEAEYVARLSHGMVDGLLIVLRLTSCRPTSRSCAQRTSPSCSSTTTARLPAATSSTPPTGPAPARASPT